MSFLHVSSALTGELILRSPLPEDADWQYIKEEIRAATGVAHFCQQLLFQEQILDGSTWLRLGRPTQLQVAFQSPSDQASQLLRAASAGAAADVAALLRRFQDPNAADESGDTTLVKACGVVFPGGTGRVDWFGVLVERRTATSPCQCFQPRCAADAACLMHPYAFICTLCLLVRGVFFDEGSRGEPQMVL